MQKTILSFGEILWDLLPDHTALGGAPFNFVYRVNSLGDTGLMVSRLGSDDLGRQALDKVSSLGMETKFLQIDQKLPTGTVKVSFDENNNPDYLIVPDVAYDRIELTDDLVAAAETADCLCFGTLVQRSAKTRRTLEQLIATAAKSVKLLDINLRKKCYSPATVSSSLENADILKLNADEVLEVAQMVGVNSGPIPDICRDFMEKYSLGYCVVTLDHKGAFAISNQGQKVYVPGFKVKLVDSLGAGDAFTAGFIYSLIRDKTLAEACELGNILGAIVCTQKGATVPVSPQDVEEFKNKNIERVYDSDFRDFLK